MGSGAVGPPDCVAPRQRGSWYRWPIPSPAVLSLLAALAFLAALSAMGIAGLRHLAPFVTTLELLAYGPVLGTVTGTVLLLGLAEPLGLGGAVLAVSIFSLLVAAAYWPRGGEWISRGSRGFSDLPRVAHRSWSCPHRRGLALLPSAASSAALMGAGRVILIRLDWRWSTWATRPRSHIGDNFPPTHPRLAGAPLAYHYLTSLTAAGMVAASLDPIVALPIQSFIFSVVLVVGLYAFGLRVTGNRAMATLALVLFMLGGSLGWVLLFDPGNGGLLHSLATNPWDAMAQQEANFWWLNPYFALIMSQRAALYGIPLVLLILTVLLVGVEDRNWRRFAFAGAVAGILPLAHLGSFAALAIIAPFLVLLFPQRGWLAFFGVWIVVGGAVLFGVQGARRDRAAVCVGNPAGSRTRSPGLGSGSRTWDCSSHSPAVALISRSVIPPASRRLLPRLPADLRGGQHLHPLSGSVGQPTGAPVLLPGTRDPRRRGGRGAPGGCSAIPSAVRCSRSRSRRSWPRAFSRTRAR